MQGAKSANSELFKDFWNEAEMEKNKSDGGIYFAIVTKLPKMKKITTRIITLIVASFCHGNTSFAQADTLRVMAYNVLYYGDNPPCQGPHSASHGYLKTIVAYANPDVISLEKMAAIPIYAGDHSGTAPAGFADSVLTYALNAAWPGRYAYCTYTNTSGADNMSVLFYNQQKLGFVNIVSSYANITDFNTYKLYYKSADLATTHDSIFLYVTCNHDNSGSASSDAATRGTQIAGEMAQIETHFTHLPNMLNMGDFNTHNSSEACYQTLTTPADTNFRFYDPAFYPDADYTYPADWDDFPATYAGCLTTSTRLSGSVPNSCGTSGGGKSWFDHIFVSSSIINNNAGLNYIPHSYRTLGNDGNRVGISVNDAPANTSAPTAVIDALFQMSNKYPVMADLAVTSAHATSRTSVQEPEERKITVANPVGNILAMNFSNDLIGKTVDVECVDMLGRLQVHTTIFIAGPAVQIPCTLSQGIYLLRITASNMPVAQMLFTKL